MAIPAGASQLISIGGFDVTNPKQIAQIAHHNAQILRQIKGLHPPVTQYHNPFPVLQPVNAQKHVLMGGNPHIAQPQSPHGIDKYPTTQNLIPSSSNVAQTMLPHMPIKSYAGSKPLHFGNGKPDLNQFKYFNGLGATSKLPNFGNGAATSQNFQIFSTTSRIPVR